MVFPEAVVSGGGVEAEADDELEVLNTRHSCAREARRWVWYLWATVARQRRGGY
jgi:hypothetical protein